MVGIMWDNNTFMYPEDVYPGDLPEDVGANTYAHRFNGEWGTNHHLPHIKQWVEELRTPWWVVEMRLQR